MLLVALLAMLPARASALPSQGADAAEAPVQQARERFEASVGPLQAAAYRPAPVVDDANAAHWFLHGAEALELGGGEGDRLQRLAVEGPAGWSGRDTAWLRQLVAREAGALALFRRAARCEASAFPPVPPQGIDGRLLDLAGAGRFLLAAGLLELTETPDRAPSLEVLAALARRLGEQPELLYTLLGLSAEQHLLRGVHHAAASPAVPPATLRGLTARLSTEPPAETYSRRIAFLVAEIAATFEEQGSGDGVSGGEEHARVLDDLRAVAQAAREPGGLEAYLDGVVADPGSPMEVTAGLLIPNILEAGIKLRAVASARELALAAVELRRVVEETGAYPPALPLPADPFSGSRPEYRRLEDGSARLANPAAEAAWEERWGHLPRPLPPFRWELPPPR